jgi:hypothetical protein
MMPSPTKWFPHSLKASHLRPSDGVRCTLHAVHLELLVQYDSQALSAVVASDRDFDFAPNV